MDPTTGQGGWPFQTAVLPPRPSVSPESQHVEIHGSFTGQAGGAASGGRGAVQAGQGLWLLTWRPRHVAAPSTDSTFPGSLWLLRRASLHQPTARVPLLPELWGAVSAMLEGTVGGPRSKSCQGCGARAGVRSSFFGKVGFGGRGVDLAGFSPGHADGEAGPAAGLCPAPGKAETYTGRWGASGAVPGGPTTLPTAACSLSLGAALPTPPAARSSLPGPPPTWRLAPDAAAWTLLRAQGGRTRPGHPALP